MARPTPHSASADRAPICSATTPTMIAPTGIIPQYSVANRLTIRPRSRGGEIAWVNVSVAAAKVEEAGTDDRQHGDRERRSRHKPERRQTDGSAEDAAEQRPAMADPALDRLQ